MKTNTPLLLLTLGLLLLSATGCWNEYNRIRITSTGMSLPERADFWFAPDSSVQTHSEREFLVYYDYSQSGKPLLMYSLFFPDGHFFSSALFPISENPLSAQFISENQVGLPGYYKIEDGMLHTELYAVGSHPEYLYYSYHFDSDSTLSLVECKERFPGKKRYNKSHHCFPTVLKKVNVTLDPEAVFIPDW